MQEELEHKSVAISIKAVKLTGRVLKDAIAAALRKMEEIEQTPEIGRNDIKKITGRDGGANTIEVKGRIRSFERIAKKYQVRYHIEKNTGTKPPVWTVFFKANQADAITAAFNEYKNKTIRRDSRPSVLEQLRKFKEAAKTIPTPSRHREKHREGPER